MKPLKLRVSIKQDRWNGPWHVRVVDNEGMVVMRSREIKRAQVAKSYARAFVAGLIENRELNMEPCAQAEIPGIGEYV